MRLWVLVIGQYSESYVAGVFDDEHKKQAEEFAEWAEGSVDGSVASGREEIGFELNKLPQSNYPPSNSQFYSIEMKRNGDIVHIHEKFLLNKWNDCKLQACYYILKTEGTRKWRVYVDNYAKSKEHAIKMANDIRSRLIAGTLPETGKLGIEKTNILKEELGDKK